MDLSSSLEIYLGHHVLQQSSVRVLIEVYLVFTDHFICEVVETGLEGLLKTVTC